MLQLSGLSIVRVGSALLASGTATAAENAKPFAAPQAATAVSPASGLVEITLALVVVLAAIFAFAWLARRARLLAGGAQDRIEVVADLPLGSKERAVLVRVNGVELLLGVAPGRVNSLHVFALNARGVAADGERATTGVTDAAQSVSAAARAPLRAPTFAELLRRSLGR